MELCYKSNEVTRCTEICAEYLDCGHQCQKKCYEKCEELSTIQILKNFKSPCTREVKHLYKCNHIEKSICGQQKIFPDICSS